MKRTPTLLFGGLLLAAGLLMSTTKRPPVAHYVAAVNTSQDTLSFMIADYEQEGPDKKITSYLSKTRSAPGDTLLITDHYLGDTILIYAFTETKDYAGRRWLARGGENAPMHYSDRNIHEGTGRWYRAYYLGGMDTIVITFEGTRCFGHCDEGWGRRFGADDTAEGYWKNSVLHGKECYYTNDTMTIRGEFAMGVANGHMVIESKGPGLRSREEADYRGGKRHGLAVFDLPTGEHLEYPYVNGVIHGDAVVRLNARCRYTLEYQMGVVVGQKSIQGEKYCKGRAPEPRNPLPPGMGKP